MLAAMSLGLAFDDPPPNTFSRGLTMGALARRALPARYQKRSCWSRFYKGYRPFLT
jgi:hypothetical protein